MQTGEPIAFKEGGRIKDDQVHEFASIEARLRSKLGAMIGVIGVPVRVDQRLRPEAPVRPTPSEHSS